MKSAIVGLAFSLGDRMTLSDLASIGSLISGLAVLASLVFLYFQLRQMTVNLVVPVRYTHAHYGVMDRADFDGMVDLVVALLQKLDAKAVAHLRDFTPEP